MSFTNYAKELLMKTEHFIKNSKYIALHGSGDTELSGNGYSRKAVTTSQMTVANTGVVTFPTNLTIYTANSNSAVQALKVSIYDAATGGNQLLTAEAISSPPAAPGNGQSFQISLTLTP